MDRDTQFAGFAKALYNELPPENIFDEQRCEEIMQIIAQRAYDLSQHTIGYTLEYLHECGLRTPGSMNLSIQPSIPDMVTLPEVRE